MFLPHQIAEKKQKRAAVVEQMRSIHARSESEKRSMTQEEQNSWNAANADVDKLDGEIRELEAKATVEKRMAELGTGSGKAPVAVPEQDSAKLARKAFRSWVRRGLMGLNDSERSALQLGSQQARTRAEEEAEVRGLEMDLPQAGGYLVPEQQLLDVLIKSIDDQTFIRSLSTVVPVVGAHSLGAPSLVTDFADADWSSEIGTVQESTTQVFGQRELTPRMLTKLVKISLKLLNSARSAESIVLQRLAYKFAITEEKAFLTGTGSGQPLGVFTASASGVPTAQDVSTGNTATTIEADNLINVKYSIKQGYQSRGSWIFHRDAMKMIRKLKDGEGQYIWQPGLTADGLDMLLNRPVYMSEYAPNTFTTGLYVGIFGDFSNYWIADAMNFAITRLNELYQANNQVGFIGRMDLDGAPVLGEAFARVKLA